MKRAPIPAARLSQFDQPQLKLIGKRLAVGAAILYAMLLLASAAWLRPLPLAGSVENDNYHGQAAALLRGEPYSDPFRPPLYAVLIALGSAISGVPPFAVGWIISCLSAAALSLITWLIGSYLLTPRMALFAQTVSMATPLVVASGLTVATDMFFAMLCAAVLAAGLAASTWRGWLFAGVLVGLAGLTRWNGLPLIAVPVYLWWRQLGWRRVGAPLVIALAGLCVISAPWWWYNAILHGSPLYNENWKNFAMAVFHPGDFDYLRSLDQSATLHGAYDVFRSAPTAVFALWANNLLVFTFGLLFVAAGSIWLGAFIVLGIIRGRHSLAGQAVLLQLLVCLLPSVLLFYLIHPRLLLPATPAAITLGCLGVETVCNALGVIPRWPAVRRVLAVVLGLGLLGWLITMAVPAALSMNTR